MFNVDATFFKLLHLPLNVLNGLSALQMAALSILQSNSLLLFTVLMAEFNFEAGDVLISKTNGRVIVVTFVAPLIRSSLSFSNASLMSASNSSEVTNWTLGVASCDPCLVPTLNRVEVKSKVCLFWTECRFASSVIWMVASSSNLEAFPLSSKPRVGLLLNPA